MSHSALVSQRADAYMFSTQNNKPTGQREGSWWVCCDVGGIVFAMAKEELSAGKQKQTHTARLSNPGRRKEQQRVWFVFVYLNLSLTSPLVCRKYPTGGLSFRLHTHSCVMCN